MKLNLGSGNAKLKGFVNVDICCEPDIKHDLNVLPYPFENNSVDYIFCNMVLEHLSIHLQDFVKECYRILKDNGCLEVNTINAFHYKNRLRFLFGRFDSSKDYHPWHAKLIKPSQLIFLLKHKGFHVEPQKTTNYWGSLEKVFPNLLANRTHLKAYKRSEK